MPAATVQGLREKGHVVHVAPRFDLEFGCAQMALKLDQGGYIAASDQRKDGCAVGI
jgi:gamma-glutamyltranspeptidase/glutathione hydrolase